MSISEALFRNHTTKVSTLTHKGLDPNRSNSLGQNPAESHGRHNHHLPRAWVEGGIPGILIWERVLGSWFSSHLASYHIAWPRVELLLIHSERSQLTEFGHQDYCFRYSISRWETQGTSCLSAYLAKPLSPPRRAGGSLLGISAHTIASATAWAEMISGRTWMDGYLLYICRSQ